MKATARGLAVTLDVEGAWVVVVGGDEEAERKVELLLDAGARVRLFATVLGPGLETWVAAGALEHHPREPEPADLDGARLVLVALRDSELARQIYDAARARGVLCWSCDDPGASDLAMPAVARLGSARFAVSTSGQSPTLAGRLRTILEDSLGERFARFVELLGALRDRVQREEAEPARRRALLQAALDGFELELTARYPEWFKS
jgi:siroheme synthase-like protein